MKNTKNRNFLLGIALLGATTLIGFNAPASARPGNNHNNGRRTQVKRTVVKKSVIVRQPVVRRPVVVQPVVRRPIVVRPVTRPTYNRYNRPNYRRTTNVVAYDGYVTRDTSGDDFEMRLSNGRVIRVYALNGEPGSLSKGDLVHARGVISGGVLRAQDVDVRRNR